MVGNTLSDLQNAENFQLNLEEQRRAQQAAHRFALLSQAAQLAARRREHEMDSQVKAMGLRNEQAYNEGRLGVLRDSNQTERQRIEAENERHRGTITHQDRETEARERTEKAKTEAEIAKAEKEAGWRGKSAELERETRKYEADKKYNPDLNTLDPRTRQTILDIENEVQNHNTVAESMADKANAALIAQKAQIAKKAQAAPFWGKDKFLADLSVETQSLPDTVYKALGPDASSYVQWVPGPAGSEHRGHFEARKRTSSYGDLLKRKVADATGGADASTDPGGEASPAPNSSISPSPFAPPQGAPALPPPPMSLQSATASSFAPRSAPPLEALGAAILRGNAPTRATGTAGYDAVRHSPFQSLPWSVPAPASMPVQPQRIMLQSAPAAPAPFVPQFAPAPTMQPPIYPQSGVPSQVYGIVPNEQARTTSFQTVPWSVVAPTPAPALDPLQIAALRAAAQQAGISSNSYYPIQPGAGLNLPTNGWRTESFRPAY
jgi:hypothetical protein